MPSPSPATAATPSASLPAPLRLVVRNVRAWQGMWLTFVSVLLEPVLFLFSIGVGVGVLVGDVDLGDGTVVPYREFVAAGLLAVSAMFGPVFDTTYNFFVKLKYYKVYDAVLATPMRTRDVLDGEVMWSQIRGACYATAFLVTMVVMGLVASWWALLAVPVASLVGYAFASAGLMGSTFMRSWTDFDWVNVALLPMFLLSATFFPLARYPEWLQHVIQVTPLYQGVVLERALVLGELSWSLLANVAYLVVMGTVCRLVAGRRMERMLKP